MVLANGSEAYKLDGGIVRQAKAVNTSGSDLASRPLSRSYTRPLASFALCLLLIMGMAVVYVSRHARMALLSDEVYLMEKKLEGLIADNGHLRLELMKLSSLDRVEGLAKGDGRMVEPGRIKYLAVVRPAPAVTEPARVETMRLDVQRLAKPAHVPGGR